MGFFSSLNIAGSGLTAQRLRMDIISENLTNMNTTSTEEGGPYRRKMVVFQSNDSHSFRYALSRAEAANRTGDPGVHVAAVVEDGSEFDMTYDPTHPDADENGYVAMPNVDLIKETTDAMAASRAYEANITAFNAMKLMAQRALEIGR